MIHGFAARRQFSDVVTYSVVFRTYEGIQRWMKIGRHGVFTPDQARQEAARVLREVALGKDRANRRRSGTLDGRRKGTPALGRAAAVAFAPAELVRVAQAGAAAVA
jgi:Arm DNA-binding domain